MMRRGDIYWVDLEPTTGTEANKTRPAVIVSNDAANRATQRYGRGALTVIPVTSNARHLFPFHVFLPAGTCGLTKDSKAQAEQIRSVDVRRLGEWIGSLSAEALSAVDNALRLQLAL